MRWSKVCIRLLIFILLITSISSNAFAQYNVGASPLPNAIIDEGDADKNISFWQLPLWIQVAFVSATLVTLLGAFKLFPVLLGKLKRLTENRRRDRIYTYIQSNPGSTVRDVSRAEGINVGSVKYHVSQLNITQRIVPKKIGKFLRLYQNSNTYSDREKLVLAAFKNETGKQILIYIKDKPGASNKQIAERFGIKESTAHWYMNSFLRDHLVKFVKEGKYKRYHLEDDVLQMVCKFTG
jgi:predicted transcriptional regulator